MQGVPRTKLCWVPHWGSLTAGNQASATLDICTPLKQIKKLLVSLESQWHFNSAMLSNHSESFSNNIWALFYIHWFQQPIKSFFFALFPQLRSVVTGYLSQNLRIVLFSNRPGSSAYFQVHLKTITEENNEVHYGGFEDSQSWPILKQPHQWINHYMYEGC